jgi:MFS family permease
MLSAFMMPISAILYKIFGLELLLAINAISFFIAAVMETRIQHQEAYVEHQKSTRDEEISYFKQVFRDLKEGADYVKSERGLLFIVVYFFFSMLCCGVEDVLTLPYFKANYRNGEYIFMLTWGASSVARMIGGALHYKFILPAKHRYAIALSVYVIINLLSGTYLFLPLGFMILFQSMQGVLGVTSYTIRISATQSYVPDEKKGRFNGFSGMMFNGGILVGQLLAAGLTVVLSERMTIFAVSMLAVVTAIIFIGGNKKYIAPIYNRES